MKRGAATPIERIHGARPAPIPMKDWLFLFDIDGTLLTSGGAGEEALRRAMRELHGIADGVRGIELAGRTDAAIARRMLERHGIETSPDHIARFLDAYLHHLERLLPEFPGRLLPGIVHLLEALRARDDTAVGLLTGNLSRGADLKLRHYGVAHFFEFGAFADDHADRNRLGPFALERAFARHGVRFAPERTFVVGDTPHDIDCGRAFGARTVAVATGHHSRAELEAHRPDHLFEDLSDIPGTLARLGLQPASSS